MDAPKRINCPKCGKEMNKASLKKHLENVCGKSKRASKKVTKKKASVPSPVPSYAIPEGEYAEAESMFNDWEMLELDSDADDLSDMFAGMKISAVSTQPSGSDSTSNKKKTRSQPELAVQRKLEKQTGGKHVMTPAGEIDLLTDTVLIEAKEWKSWKTAVGQVICYGHFYPKHMKRIHFFGPHPPEEKKIIIFTILTSLGIQFTYEKDIKN